MSPENNRQLYAKKEAVRNNIVELIIQLSTEGKIDWDFSLFDELVYGQMARGEYKGVTFVSNDWEDGVEFIIIIGEKKEDRRVVDNFKGRQAMRLREFLGELASEDPTLKQIRRKEKTRIRKLEEAGRKELEKDTKKLGEIVQLFQTQS